MFFISAACIYAQSSQARLCGSLQASWVPGGAGRLSVYSMWLANISLMGGVISADI